MANYSRKKFFPAT